MLYTINKSPFLFGNLESCLRVAPAEAPVLLYEDGVYAAAAGTRLEPLVRQAAQSRPVYALEADLTLRGIDRLVEGVRVVGYDGFVDLVAEHNVTPWL
ncbi:MAG: sulfurtransferase complex subunit TusB [Anaerolineae bacterium]